ncbi:Wzz/FepE/Etk N-terminal domain-containing protein [Desulfovibrio subterraneus]|uniref:XrtA system polysaccharide chain length determinant n=1 Tax=Desulfovibrio subterraneus TaxID=2718620 RepID=UPI0022B86AA7|nr:XrtA system polysaccharide chain length determinant [Desulfovibrio subterraneus]WBF67448.1 Wzz/FepE/Etk N-terminal domain-containing protein [Desulfovibrio subterraneus]
MNGQDTVGAALDNEESSLDIGRYVSLILEFKGLFAIVALTVMTIGVVVSYALPKRYEARSTVFIEQNVVNDLVKGIAVTPSMDNKVKAIKVTMLSRTMLLKVINELDLDAGIMDGSGLESLVGRLQKTINVTMDEKKGVFVITYRDEKPRRAADVVNTLARLYIEDNTSSKRQESYEATKFLADQIEVFKKRIDDAEAAIDRFKTESGKFLSKDEVSLRDEIGQMENRLAQTQAQVNSLQATKRILLGNTPLRRQLKAQEEMLSSQLARYTESHPEVVRVKSLMASTRQKLATEGDADRRAVYGTAEYQQVKVELESLENVKRTLEASLAENREILMMIPSKRTELAELQRKRDNEVLIYEKLVSRYGQSEVSKEMELQNKSVNFRVLDPAVPSSMHVSPKRPLIILGSIVLGLGLGIGLIILKDLLNPSIKSAESIKRMGIPVFAEVPIIGNVTDNATKKRRDMFIYLTSGVYFSLILVVLGLEVLNVGLIDTAVETIRKLV